MIDQMRFNTVTEPEEVAQQAVTLATKQLGEMFRHDIRVRSTYEGYGLLTERSAVLKSEVKNFKKLWIL